MGPNSTALVKLGIMARHIRKAFCEICPVGPVPDPREFEAAEKVLEVFSRGKKAKCERCGEEDCSTPKTCAAILWANKHGILVEEIKCDSLSPEDLSGCPTPMASNRRRD